MDVCMHAGCCCELHIIVFWSCCLRAPPSSPSNVKGRKRREQDHPTTRPPSASATGTACGIHQGRTALFHTTTTQRNELEREEDDDEQERVVRNTISRNEEQLASSPPSPSSSSSSPPPPLSSSSHDNNNSASRPHGSRGVSLCSMHLQDALMPACVFTPTCVRDLWVCCVRSSIQAALRHDLDELALVDEAVLVVVELSDHLFQLLLGNVLSKLPRHHLQHNARTHARTHARAHAYAYAL